MSKNFIIKMVILSFILPLSKSFSTQVYEFESQGNLNKSFKNLCINNLPQTASLISAFKIEIDKTYEKASINQLHYLFNVYSNSIIDEENLKSLAQQLSIFRWPSQKTWKEVVGGYLFFPAERLYQYLETDFTEYLAGRRDMMTAYAMAAKFHHPLGYFYLGERLIEMNKTSLGEPDDNREHYDYFLNQAFKDFNQCLDQSDVLYAIANISTKHYFAKNMRQFNYNQQERFTKTSLDFKNQLSQLVHRTRNVFMQLPQLENFLKLVNDGYKPAYFEALAWIDNDRNQDQNKNEQKLKIVNKAIEAEYAPVLIYQASQDYRDQKLERAKRLFNRAGELGIPYSYVMYGQLLVGEVTSNSAISWQKLQQASQLQKREAIIYFQKACNLYDPQGYHHLGSIHHKLATLDEQKNRTTHLQKAYDTWIQGAKLGCINSYQSLFKFFGEKLSDDIIDNIGPYPDIESAEYFKNFINVN